MSETLSDLFNNAGFIALVGTLFGGAGLKVIDHWLSKSKQKADQGAAIRAELRVEIESLRTQLEKAAAEEQRLEGLVDKWQGAYYDLRDEKQQVVTELMIVMERLKQYQRDIDGVDNGGQE